MKIRVKDIAAKAKVSPATVSNALNGKPGVSLAVTERIRSIAIEMGYELPKARPDRIGQYIRLVIFKVHGLVVEDTQFFAELIESIQRECQTAGLELIITHINASIDTNYRQTIHDICKEECEGILLLGTEISLEQLHLFIPCASKLVVLDNLFRHVKVHSVVMNNYEAGYEATNALYHAGHRKIGHITSSVSFSNIQYRKKGYESAMKEHALPIETDSILMVTPTMQGAYADMKAILQEGPITSTAFFVGNDIMAVGCMHALNEAGYRVPEDVSLIGMDDTAICLACNPPMSTMRVHRREMGITAVRTLLSLTSDIGSCTIKTELGVELNNRNSVRILG